MRVLLNTPELANPGGVAYYYRCVRPHLAKDVEYFVIGARRCETSLRNGLRIFRDYVYFIAKLKAGNYDVVHLNPSFVAKAILRDALFLLIAKAFRTKVIVFMRGWNEVFARFVQKYLGRLFRLVYSKADVFIVLSADFEDELIEMGIRKPIIRETTVVADEVIARIDAQSVITRRKEEKGDFHILFLSRIEKSKGIYIALDTLRLLREKDLPVTMAVAGDGREVDRARRYAERNRIETVEFLGYLNSGAKHIAFCRADMYFFPTFHGEGMPNSLLEAMAYGLPVIARPVGGIKDFFEDGKMGFLTDSLSCAVFAELIESLIENRALREEMGRRNHSYVVERCMASSVAKRLQSIYSMV